MTEQEIAGVYETLLSMPAMEDPVKLDLKMSRKMVLLLAHILEKWPGDMGSGDLLTKVIAGSPEPLKQLVEECLGKSGLKELHFKLQQLR